VGVVIPQPSRFRTGRRLAVAGAVGAALAVGGVAVAQAATSAPAPSPSASASPSASPSTGSPGKSDPQRPERTPRLAGTVVSAADGTITITDVQGFRRTIRVDGDTDYSEGLTATPAAGTRIMAEGTIASDRTSLDATRVSALPDRAEGGPRQRPDGPPGRRGPHGDLPDRPGPDLPAPGTPDQGTPAPTSPAPTSPAPTSPAPTPTG
jgi:hypothetical protein